MKTGAVLYASVLQWNATRLLGSMAAASGDQALVDRMAKVSARGRETVCGCVCASVCVRVCAWVRACVRGCVRACVLCLPMASRLVSLWG